jgi:Xaa-Pro aminopeptidase
MLTEKEKEWLNTYHKKVFETLSPYLDAEEKAWLEENTRSI